MQLLEVYDICLLLLARLLLARLAPYSQAANRFLTHNARCLIKSTRCYLLLLKLQISLLAGGLHIFCITHGSAARCTFALLPSCTHRLQVSELSVYLS